MKKSLCAYESLGGVMTNVKNLLAVSGRNTTISCSLLSPVERAIGLDKCGHGRIKEKNGYIIPLAGSSHNWKILDAVGAVMAERLFPPSNTLVTCNCQAKL